MNFFIRIIPLFLVTTLLAHSTPHQFYIGPEIYHVSRSKSGGAKQDGTVYAGKIGYDYIKRYCFYFGAEALYGSGTLTGKANGERLKSRFIDAYAEGRIGYTFQQKCGCRLAFTPYVGGGYASEKNNFVHPSPLDVHFEIRYPYVCTGFLSSMKFNERWDVGINFKAKYPYDPRNHVTHDPDFDDSKMLVKECWHYRIEIPITYQLSCPWHISFVPFYEYRKYGNQANFPFDFVETQLHTYGALLKFMYYL